MEENLEKKINILDYWIDIESSTPPSIRTSNFTNKGDSKWNQTISFTHKDDILWANPLKKNIKEADFWIHKVFLGIFNTKFVIEEYSSEDLVEVKSTYDTCLVSFLVDGSGVPIKNSIVIPDYIKSIALSTVENEDQAKLFEVRIKDMFATWIFGLKKGSPLSKESMIEFLNKIMIELNWELLSKALDENEFKSLAYSESLNIKKLKENEKPKFETNDITSSLIVDDLEKVRKNLKSGIISKPLERYLSEKDFESKDRIDVIRNNEFFKDGLDIENIPMACWPITGKFPLVSSQQFAVNKIFKEIDNQHILSVNGPPGTGKTTLLKDVVANIIFQRAEQMLKFKKNPAKAFTEIGETSLTLNSKKIQKIFKLDQSISGYEVVVASSNNGAVENITKEFPLKEEIDKDYHESLKYLTEIATNMNEKDSWGLISASLGNRKNNYNFYMKVLYSKANENGATQSVFDYLSRPNYFLEERLGWEDACINLEDKIFKVKKIKEKIIEIKNSLNNYEEIKKELLDSKNRYNLLSKRVKGDKLSLLKKIKDNNKKIKEYQSLKDKFLKAKNGLFKKNLKEMHERLVGDYKALKLKNNEINGEKRLYSIKLKNLDLELKKFNELKSKLNKVKENYNKYAKETNQEIPFDSFWEQGYVGVQKSSPWHSEELNKARVEVFIASMQLHKAFIIENSSYVISNLNAFKQVLNGTFYEDEVKIRSVWEVLFLVVPVISTTFSSLDKLFEGVSAESIGWLLIDEAGQSTVQSPIGSLWRSKRAVFVGDPLQVKPVIQIEDKLSNVLLDKNKVSQYWSSTMLSAQEIADRQNPFGTEIDLGEKKWVGMPLRVHRRCDEPMFSISNRIAYNNLMIFGKKRAREKIDIENKIGKTCWFNIESEPENNSHWVQEEGNKLLELLVKICHSDNYEYGNDMPNIYVITPFKNISYELKSFLRKKKEQWMPKNISDNDFEYWINNAIGTIHSFQGDETDVVFLVLGGNTARPGAINWVCDEPNILNVATTRAKKAFYIIGNKKIWNKGVFGLVKNFIK